MSSGNMLPSETAEMHTLPGVRAGFEPDTFHGQHFLIDPTIVEAITDRVPVGANCVEIGAGTGVLTGPLLDKVGRNGQVIAYEIDDRCLPVLGGLRGRGNLEVRHQDFLKVDEVTLNRLDDLYLVGNVPYHILEPLLRQMIDIQFVEAVLMLPNRFRDTVMARHAGDREWRKSTIISTAFFDVETVIDAPRDAFDPAPPVDSTVVRFSRNEHSTLAASDPIIRAYRAIATTLTSDETVASALRKISVRPDGSIEGGGATNDHKRHRRERRTRANDLRQLEREWNTNHRISQEVLNKHTGFDLLEVAKKALNGDISRINAPLGGVDSTAIRRVCAAIEGVINKGRKLGPRTAQANDDEEFEDGLDD